MSHQYPQMSVETKNILGPLFGHDAKSPASAISGALCECAEGVGMDEAPALTRIVALMLPIVERIAFLDARLGRYTERVRGRVEQLRYEAMAGPGRILNDPVASYRILAEDAGEAARDARERGELHKVLLAHARLIRELYADLTGADFTALGTYARAS